jgi:hypothetical protein
MVVTGYIWESWLYHRPKEDRDQRTQVYFSQRSVPIIVDLSVLFRNARMESLVNGIHALFFRLAQVQAILQPKC